MFNVMNKNEMLDVNGGRRMYPVYKMVWVGDHYEKKLIGYSTTPVIFPGFPEYPVYEA